MKKSCKIVAEGCCNHLGKLDVAIEMIKMAKICGADYIKWQKRNPVESVPKEWHNKPHPNQSNAFGSTYLEHRVNLEFSLDQHKELKKVSDDIGIGYSCSVWDMTSAAEIASLNPDFIKIPSAANTCLNILSMLFKSYDGDLHISLGMMTKLERENLFGFLENYKDRVVIYHTTTEYPCPFDHLYLREVENLKKMFPVVGYSGHNYGIAADVIAYSLGASWIERHFSLDRTMKGTDHAASLEPDGLRRLCRDIVAIEKALKFKEKDMTDMEESQRSKLKISNSL